MLNYKPKYKIQNHTILEESIGLCLHNLVVGKDFLDRTPKRLTTKEKFDNLVFIKIKNYYASKDTAKKMNR